jgi:hypothetical protein
MERDAVLLEAREAKAAGAGRFCMGAAWKGVKEGEAKFESVRGAFKFNTNQYPIQNYYLREVQKDAQGRLVNKIVSQTPVLASHGDAYVQDCPMK